MDNKMIFLKQDTETLQEKKQNLTKSLNEFVFKLVKNIVLKMPIISSGIVRKSGKQFRFSIHKTKYRKEYAFSIYEINGEYLIGCVGFKSEKESIQKMEETTNFIRGTK